MTPASSSTPPVRWLLGFGGALTVLGVYLVVRSSWGELVPVVRMLLVLVPLAATYAMAWSAAKREATRGFVDELLLTAGLILPFSVGAALVQAGAFEGWTSLLTFCMSLLALVIAALLNLAWKQEKQSALVALSGIVAVISIGTHYDVSFGWHMLFLAGLGLILLDLGLIRGVARSWERTSYHRIGLALFAIGGATAPFALSQEYLANSGLTLFLGYAAFGLSSLLIAVGAGRRYQAALPDTLLYELRVAAEWCAGLALSVGMVMAGFSGSAGDLLAALLLSVGLFVLGSTIPFPAYRFLGGAASVMLFVGLLADTLEDLLAYWPVALVTLGIGAMWYALRLANGQAKKTSSPVSTITPWNNLGLPLPAATKQAQSDDNHGPLAGGLPYPTAASRDSTNGWAGVGILIGILLFLSIL